MHRSAVINYSMLYDVKLDMLLGGHRLSLGRRFKKKVHHPRHSITELEISNSKGKKSEL